MTGEIECNHCGDGKGTDNKTGSTSSSSCKHCASGKYSISEIIDGIQSDTGCRDCQLGRYQDEDAKTKCKLCPSGSGTNNIAGSKSINACIACVQGYHSSDMGCVECPPGTYNDQLGTTICKMCPGKNQTTRISAAKRKEECYETKEINSVVATIERYTPCARHLCFRSRTLQSKDITTFKFEDDHRRRLTTLKTGCGAPGENHWRRQVISAFEARPEIDKFLFTRCTDGAHQVRVTMKASDDFDEKKANDSLRRIYNQSPEIKRLVSKGSINILGVNKRKLCSASDFACTDGASIDESAACATSTCDVKLDFGDESSRCCMMKISANSSANCTVDWIMKVILFIFILTSFLKQ